MSSRIRIHQPRKRSAALAAVVAAVLRVTVPLITAVILFAGCGTPAAPSAPSLKLPDPATDLTAVRVGDEVTLQWTMPKRSTDKLMLRGPQRAQILRTLESGSATSIAELTFAPLAQARYTDKLPTELTSGALRQLTYTVKLQNRVGQSAANSNLAYSAAGAAPPPVTGFAAKAGPDGVLLHWDTAPGLGMPGLDTPGAELALRIHRKLEAAPPQKKKDDAFGHPEKDRLDKEHPDHLDKEAILSIKTSAGTGIDPSAIPDRKYSYIAERVFLKSFEDHKVEVTGLASDAVEVDTRDVFPPKPPGGLAAIAVPEQSAIDLSWTPNTESDLAGYVVYRREGQGAWARISPETPVPSPEFRDGAIERSHGYSYAVAAIDRSGNESARSAAADERLP